MERRRQRLLLAVIFLAICFLLYRSSDGYETLRQRTRGGSVLLNAAQDVDLRGLEPANATLGFGAVVAVSRAGSPRRDGLLLASNITEIDITIPTQPKWTDKDVKNLRAEKDSTITKGSALAWLGHLNA
ncbi:hypothetical protein KC328_g16648, partial [Hortaea werneckii]